MGRAGGSACADATQQIAALACLPGHQLNPPRLCVCPRAGLQAAAAADMAVMWRERDDQEAMEAEQYNFPLEG